MGITNLALAKYVATDAGLLAIVQEIQPVREEKGRFTKMLLNGTGSKVVQRAKAEKVKDLARARHQLRLVRVGSTPTRVRLKRVSSVSDAISLGIVPKTVE